MEYAGLDLKLANEMLAIAIATTGMELLNGFGRQESSASYTAQQSIAMLV